MNSSRAVYRVLWACRVAVLLLLLMGFSRAAQASLLGDEVRIQISATDTTFVVVSGTDPDFSVSSFNWNVESSSFVFWIANIPGGTLAPNVFFTLSDLDFTPSMVIVDAAVVASAGLFAGAMDDILTVGSDSIEVDLSSFANGSLDGVQSLEVEFATEVPEPAAAGMLAVGGTLLGVARARKNRGA